MDHDGRVLRCEQVQLVGEALGYGASSALDTRGRRCRCSPTFAHCSPRESKSVQVWSTSWAPPAPPALGSTGRAKECQLLQRGPSFWMAPLRWAAILFGQQAAGPAAALRRRGAEEGPLGLVLRGRRGAGRGGSRQGEANSASGAASEIQVPESWRTGWVRVSGDLCALGTAARRATLV
jgi:hypothetical protein